MAVIFELKKQQIFFSREKNLRCDEFENSKVLASFNQVIRKWKVD